MGNCNCLHPRPGGCPACNPTPVIIHTPTPQKFTYEPPLIPKRAGDSIRCPKCGGKGYTLEGLDGTLARECGRCGGRGSIVIQPNERKRV